MLERAERAFTDIAMRRGGEQLRPIQPILVDTYALIAEMFENKGQIRGVPTGYTELDDMTTGLHGGEMILIAARPSMGKTAIGMNIVENAAIRCKKKAAVFSLEMPAEQLARAHALHRGQARYAKCAARPPRGRRLGKALQRDDHHQRRGHLCGRHQRPFRGQIRSKARRLQTRAAGWNLVMIDYLQLMSARAGFGSRQEEVSTISRTLKGLARS